ncbi:Z1 domain-containing protein [Prevotella sp. SGI.027]
MHFDNLEAYLDFEAQLRSFGQEPNAEMLAEKARLEAAQNVNEDEYVFGTMAAHNKFMTPEKEKVVREMTDQLMMEGENATQPCLLLGKVQCGKTDTFLSIMGLCFDRGIDVAVVMTKGTNTLTKQTIERLNKDFRFFKDDGTYGQKVVIYIYDILDLYKRGGLSDYQLNDPANKFIIVCKKENTNLKDLIELFENSEILRRKKVLVCDDEADFASRAYYQRKGELSLLRIAEHIEKFVTLPAFCRYMQITATPYSLYLQPDGTVQLRDGQEASPWLPRYTGLVPIHDKYIGGKQYYVDSQEGEIDDEGIFHPANMYGCLYQPVDQICIDILSARNEFYLESRAHSENLDSLNFAVVSYLFAAAVRTIQTKKKSNKKYYSSCLIHCEINKHKHAWQEELITEIIEDIKQAFLHKANSDLHILDLESDAYESLKLSNELGNRQGLINEKFPTFAEVEAEVKRILEYNDYTINVVNSEEPGKVATMLNDKGQLRLEQALNFFIGGSILDRGITIDNMLCFFYGRDPKKFQMDTVLQHARMYGARDKEDMACTRFFTTPDIYDVLKTMNVFDDYLYQYLKAHRDTVQTDDFTSMVIGYDKRISPSAQNKYTPANTKVLKPYQRTYPVGFQTIEPTENNKLTKKIEEVLQHAVEGKKANEDGFYLVHYNDIVEILSLIRESYTYATEYNNVGLEWDINDMVTPLEHLTYDTDGMVLVTVRGDRNLSRERENIFDKRGRFIDAPEAGGEIKIDKKNAIDRPVLVLLKQNGSKDLGWRGTAFYWPVLTTPQNMNAGIFTVNGNKKFRKAKKQIELETLGNYPKDEVLSLTIKKEFFFDIILDYRKEDWREIKATNANLFLEKDLMGKLILVEGTDPDKYYDLTTVNDNIFPFEVKDYKYLHLRTSMDLSGSQAIIKLKEDDPYEMVCRPFEQQDVVYTEFNEGQDVTDQSAGVWNIVYHLDMVLEKKLTPEDTELLQNYVDYLASIEQESGNESNA